MPGKNLLPNATDHRQFERLVRHRPRWTAYAAVSIVMASVASILMSIFRSDLAMCRWMPGYALQFTPLSTFRFGPRMRSLLADESNIAIRNRAIRAGFWSGLVAVVFVILADHAIQITAAQAAEIIGGIALAGTCVTHAFLDRRTLADPS